jgi:D-aminopeptidase
MRLRDLISLSTQLTPGALNAITDVEGVRVGHHTLLSGDAVRTGVTAILPHDGNVFREKVAAGVHTINGFGKATGFEQIRERGVIETPILLTNTLSVGRASDALIAYMLRENDDIGLTTGTVNPVVGECNDGFLNDIRGRHVDEDAVWQAIDSAAGGAVVEGNVGAGTGTSCFQFKGGIGTASRVTSAGITVGALVQTNYGSRSEMTLYGAPLGQKLLSEYLPQPGPGSAMMIIATDAPLDARQLTRLARRAPFALGRTGTFGHDGSGDFAIAFSTTNLSAHAPHAAVEMLPRFNETRESMDSLFLATVEALEEAIWNAVVAAETLTGRDGNTLTALPHDDLARWFNEYHGRLS